MTTIYERVRSILRDDPSQRIGQAFYNAARIEDEWLGRVIDGTRLDPFNDDAALPRFLEEWHEEFGARA